ncbi:alpha-glucosidase [Nitratireductor thuwali]|uniref:Oligo-1,6-glucosidase n=1 Tax=Nitratireductor thuwali TaxID=2267699 RepID=A0ABY5MG24_9HYPH|nr:Oligo-1,6-glucosidase [Nitratireductor thuwali]
MNAHIQADNRPDLDWWRGAVIYQIYPRSFQDSDGDGIGDLQGITRRLPYVASLGVDAVWISPFFKSPQKDFGYDISDYRDVDPMFGTLADFDALIAEAHRLGIKIIIDQVYSHTSDKHPWFAESRASRDNSKADWYVWADPKPDGTPPNNWLSVFGGSSWHWDTTRRQYYLHHFLVSQPDLNFHNPEVQDAVLDTARFWLDRGVDGFRLDTLNFFFHSAGLEDNPALPPEERNAVSTPAVNPYSYQRHVYDKNRPENLDFLKRFRTLLNEYPGAVAVGEVGESHRGLELIGAYTSGGDKVHMCYSFDFLAPDPLTPAHIRKTLTDFDDSAPDGWSCWSFSNHDVVRHASRWADRTEDRDAYLRMAATLLLTIKGSACLYQGEELGLTEAILDFDDLQDPYGIQFWPEFKGRDGCRTPMVWESGSPNGGFSAGRPWLPVPAEHLHLAVSEQEHGQSLLQHYRMLIALRSRNIELTKGALRFIGDSDAVLAFERRFGDRAIVVAINMSGATVHMDLPGAGLGAIAGFGDKGRLEDGRLTLEPHGYWLARQRQGSEVA